MFWRRHAVHDDDLSAYVDGQLSAAARARIEAHVEACPSCGQTVAELRELRSALRELPRATAPRSFALREADARPATPEPEAPFARAVPMLGGLTALAVLAFFVLLGFDATVDLDEANDTGGGAALLSGQEERAPSASDAGAEPAVGDAEALDDANAGAETDGGVTENSSDGEAYAADSTPQPLPDRSAPGNEEPADGEVAPLPGATEARDLEVTSQQVENGAPNAYEPTSAQPDGDGWPAIRVAEAAAAGVALAAGASLAFVWRRRRT